METDHNSDSESINNNYLEPEISLSARKLPAVWLVLLILGGLILLGQVLAAVFAATAGNLSGIDWQILGGKKQFDSTLVTRLYLRFGLFVSHFFGIFLPSAYVLYCFYKNKWKTALGITQFPSLQLIALSILLLVVTLPFEYFSADINKMIPLPAFLKSSESSADEILKAVLKKDFNFEILLNLLLIGVLPAISEELMFRGVIQQQLGRIFRNPHVMVWTTACIFSAFHIQFEGFFPRAILGAVLGYLFYWTKNIFLPMIVHMINNSALIVIIYASGVKIEDLDKLDADKHVHWFFAACSVVMMIVVSKMIQQVSRISR